LVLLLPLLCLITNCQLLIAYLGGGVVVVLDPFLLFLPPLCALEVLVAFLPLVLGGVWVSVLPPPVCANARVAPSSMVITNVNSFFMQSPQKESFCPTLVANPLEHQ